MSCTGRSARVHSSELVSVEVRRGEERGPAIPALGAGEVALLDPRRAEPARDHAVAATAHVHVDMPLRILTDAAERRALVIPVTAGLAVHAALTSGIYQLAFLSDHLRWRAQSPDAASSHRAARTLVAAS